MNTDIKYTTDGKKVKVIGQLNSKQIIVREIFIDGETEIPSGEDFIVTSLHDSPVVSWKEKNILEIESNYKRIKDNLSSMEKALKGEYEILSVKLKEKNDFIKKYLKSTTTLKAFDFVDDVLNGRIKYIVPVRLWKIEIREYNDFIDSFGSLKLLSLLGNDGGDMTLKINHYSDGSGGNTEYAFFKTRKDAEAYIINRIENTETLTQEIVLKAKEYGAKLDKKKVKEWKKKQIASITKNMDKTKNSLLDYNSQLDMIKNL